MDTRWMGPLCSSSSNSSRSGAGATSSSAAAAPGPGPAADFCPLRTEVHISHLRSYSGMGTADVECVSGCTCQPSILDGTTASRVSVFKTHTFEVGGAEQGGSQLIEAWQRAACIK